MAMGSNLPSSELERMASELKCPICLSLYKQAASLSCNHCFCTACIVQSMKRTSCCPICKVPAAPREVRPAPQMDSLVAIFKGMETSAGVSLFQTQQSSQLQSLGAPEQLAKQGIGRKPPKRRGRNNKAQVSNHAPHSETTKNSHRPKKRRRGRSESVLRDSTNQRTGCGMGSRITQKGGEDVAIQGAVPAGMKVRASGNTLLADNRDKAEHSKLKSVASEPHATASFSRMANLVVPENEELNPSTTGNQGSEDVLRVDLNDECPVLQEKEGEDSQHTCCPNYDNLGAQPPQLSPFFWLRDRVLPSQDEPPTQITQTQGAARPLRPSFSDLKSSDDDDDDQLEIVQRPDDIAGNELPDSYDSDMFVWSQRPCSPELSSSPEEDFDQLLQSKPNSCNEEQSVLGRDENSRHGAADDESKSPPKSVAEAPVEVEATQTPQVHQEPSRMIRGTLSKCSKLQSLHSGQSSGKVRRRLKSNDHSSLINKDHQKLPREFVGPKKSTRKRARKHDRNMSDSSCEEIRLEVNLDSSSNEVPITAEESLEQNCAHQNNCINKDAVPENQNDTSGGQTRAADGKLSQQSVKDGPSCVFCLLAGDSEVAGPLVEYKDAFPSKGQTRIKAVLVHKLCAEWAPDVYFNEDEPRNLACEVTRGQKIKCSSCGMRGAALGCCNKRCRRSFHYPCGRATPGCKWDEDDFVMFCPQHAECKFPRRKRCRISPCKGSDPLSVERDGIDKSATQGVSTGERLQRWPTGPACKWVLCGSGLDSQTKEQLAAFASVTGASVVKRWSLNVTHVITGTDERGGARRTLKFLLAILQGKWIVKCEWMGACLSAGHIIPEDQYEVTSDSNGFRGGPQRSRALAAARGPKLLEGLSFFFSGEFSSVSKEDLQALIVAGRGVVLHRKPLPLERIVSNSRAKTIVLYSGEDDVKKTAVVAEQAKSLAVHAGASAVPHTWLLDVIAACEMHPFP